MIDGLRWSKFYWDAWERDLVLKKCSLAAQGLWMRMLCQMDANKERGFLMENGVPCDAKAIAWAVGGYEVRMVSRLLAELEAKGVLSRDERGAIFSRRLVKENEISQRNTANGRKGGNPKLIKNNELAQKSVNPPLEVSVKAEEKREERKQAAREPAHSAEEARAAVRIPTPPPAPTQPHRPPGYTAEQVSKHALAFDAAAGIMTTGPASEAVAARWLHIAKPEVILDVIQAVRRRGGSTARSLGYFDKMVAERVESDKPPPAVNYALTRALETWARNGCPAGKEPKSEDFPFTPQPNHPQEPAFSARLTAYA